MEILLEQQKTTQFLLATLMNMNPELKAALPAAVPSPPLLLRSVAYGSIVSRSNSREEESVQRLHSSANVPISPQVNVVAVKDWAPTSSALYATHGVVTRGGTTMHAARDDGEGAEGD